MKFHGDWGELTAEDNYSLNRAADKERFPSPEHNGSAVAIDPRTVRIELSYPAPGFLGLVANYHGGNIVSKKAAEALGADFNSKPVELPTLAERVTQQYVRLKANKNYFAARGSMKSYRFILGLQPRFGLPSVNWISTASGNSAGSIPRGGIRTPSSTSSCPASFAPSI